MLGVGWNRGSRRLQRVGELLDGREALLWIFREGFHDHRFNGRRNIWRFFAQGRRGREDMLTGNLHIGALKGASTR